MKLALHYHPDRDHGYLVRQAVRRGIIAQALEKHFNEEDASLQLCERKARERVYGPLWD